VRLTLSVLESLARLPVSEREAILASLSESEAEQLQYDWSFYARPNQLLPAGNWLTWLLLAGRGFGKRAEQFNQRQNGRVRLKDFHACRKSSAA
jgi:hypothetical protein